MGEQSNNSLHGKKKPALNELNLLHAGSFIEVEELKLLLIHPVAWTLPGLSRLLMWGVTWSLKWLKKEKETVPLLLFLCETLDIFTSSGIWKPFKWNHLRRKNHSHVHTEAIICDFNQLDDWPQISQQFDSQFTSYLLSKNVCHLLVPASEMWGFVLLKLQFRD